MLPAELELIEVFVNNHLPENEFGRLCELLEHNSDARAYYRSYAGMDSGLRVLAFAPPELREPHSWDEADNHSDQSAVSTSNHKQAPANRTIQFMLSRRLFAAAAVIAGIAIILSLLVFNNIGQREQIVATVEYISDDAQILTPVFSNSDNKASTAPIEMTSGVLKLRFNSGAVITLYGPARFIPLDDRGGKLEYGIIWGKAPEDRKGLHVVGPNFDVTDLGTEFALKVEKNNGSELLVINGSVALKSQGGEEVVAKQDDGYHIDPKERISLLSKVQVQETFGKILLTRRGSLEILTPETLAYFSFAGNKPDEWRDAAVDSPISNNVSADQQTGAAIINGSEIISLGSRKDLMIDSPLSFEARIFVEQTGEDLRFFSVHSRVSDNRTGWAISMKEDANGLFIPAFNHYRIKKYEFPTVGLPVGRWVHFMFTVDETTVRLYIDGVLQGESQREGPMFKDANCSAFIGGGRKDNLFKGKIAYIAIHRRVLTPQDIQSRLKSGDQP